jgi:hypothetical protein
MVLMVARPRAPMQQDAFTPYEQGLIRLLSQLGATHARYREALIFEARLRENIAQVRRSGDTENRRADRIEVLDQLSNLALENLQTSFNVLCSISSSLFHSAPSPFRTAVLRMVEDYEAVFGGRDAELAALDAFLTQDKQPYTLLLAPTGRGKTALLIHWIAGSPVFRPPQIGT